MNLVRYTQLNIPVNPATRIPAATWLLIDYMNGDGVLASIRIQIRSNIIRKGIVAIWIMTNELSVYIDFRIHINPAKFQADLLI